MESLQDFVTNRELGILLSAFISGGLLYFIIRYCFIEFYEFSFKAGILIKPKPSAGSTYEKVYLNIARVFVIVLTILPFVGMLKWIGQFFAMKMAPVGYILHEKITTGIPSDVEAGLKGVLGGNSFTDIYSDYGYMIIANNLTEIAFWFVIFYFFLGRFSVANVDQEALEIALLEIKKADKKNRREVKAKIRKKSIQKWIMLSVVAFAILHMLTAIYYIAMGLFNPSEVVPYELTSYLRSL